MIVLVSKIKISINKFESSEHVGDKKCHYPWLKCSNFGHSFFEAV